MNSTGSLHLIPVGLGESPPETWLPHTVRELAGRLTTYIAENAKTARAFLKLVGTAAPLQEITIHTLSDKVDAEQIRLWLAPLLHGGEIGLVSEAGCPAVADPGAKVVAAAHAMGIRVQPWVGPSSILLSLMGSGLDGQRFAFHGYAPVDPGERAKQLKAWEIESQKQHQTQILIETPYRNSAMFDTLKQTLKGTTRLCIARSLTTQEELIQTRSIGQWKTAPAPDLNKKPTIFLFLA
ncbi:SAM-dependent methyltransferase [Eoetvoesiella caeni]|uniref:16S rRNA (Cytidine1402-2'-O)-methyltransferase n=1 Tax=Eoetvoesiella caeni TaxID=645616 RepID=A0A366HLL0_9BURK|nr:SAM-dependent methyltransferase [Eoetvoesiella caeni]MCI2807122.1 SAM-dependent methyltransferase [Eoetvoesiella caeni]NYT53481.1 SAM-dependent methyltransferase [Eoetvoesiella caeni]RBP43467.1 16S rRNA (cytidine1402-2'-O)-methyltransferase [Eoetvoesiella caeni]